MTFLLQVTLILLVRLSELWAYPGGPPLSTCDFMTPHHGDAKPQTVMAPYSITVSKSAYTTGENLTVTISGTKTFKGFILHAQGTDSAVAWPVGEFNQVPNGAQYLYCSGGEPKNTVAHNNPGKTEWNSRQFTWMAPAKSAGNITFVATIVENFSTFWTKVMSSVVSGPPAEVVTRGAPTESFQIGKTGCGKTKGCYSLPSNCAGSSDCTYLFTYQVSGENVTMEMSAKERWAAVAFNEQKKMDKMDAIMCATMATNLAELRHYYSNNHNLIRQNLAGNSDITLNKIVYEDGGIKCKMTRKLTSSEAHFRDLKKKWYLIFSHGKTSPSGSAQYHRENKTFTGDMVNISVAAVLVDEQSQAKETINKDGCGKTKSCYSEPESCKSSSECDYLVTIRPVAEKDDSEVEFGLSSKEQWVAIGFNKEKNKMPDTDALICADVNGKVSVDHYVADKGYGTPTKTTPRPSSIVLDYGELIDGVLTCRFRRKKKDDKMVDLTQSWYLVYASGPMSGDSIAQHSSTPKTSAEKVDVNMYYKERFQINKDGCGKTKSCYFEPESCKSSSECDYLVTIRPVREKDDSDVEFELSAKKQWVSIGFNKEKNEMPDTDALICADVNGKVSVDHYVADKGYGTPTKTTPRPSSIVLDYGELIDGVLTCRFRRKKKDDKMVDLTQSWYLVYASGPMSGDSIGQHSSHPKTSAEKIDVNKIGELGAEKEGSGMIQAHGCLMVIAWVGFASIGIFMARYMKVAFGEKVLLGTKVWFTFHRSLMVLTVLVTIISIIIIFVHAGRWTKEAGAHPVTGIIVLVLAVIQPIMALFRPHPGEANRYIFNWAHRGVGLSALIMAVVTVFLGIRLPDASLDDSALYAMIVYCVGVAIVIAFDVFLSFKKDDRSASFSPAGGEKDAGGHVQLEEPAAGDKFVSARQLMLGFLVALVTGVTIALVVLIATAGGEGAHEH